MAAVSGAVAVAALSEASSPCSTAWLSQEPLPWRRTCSDPELTRRDGPGALPWCPRSLPDFSTIAGSDQTECSEPEEFSSSTPCTWRLVWCHERCHKREAEPRRRLLAEAAKMAGASLICLKKAGKFAAWLAKDQRPPYLLLTDWREVKPCMQAAAREHVSNQPVFTVVLCEESRRHFDRASTWAESLPARADPVHVCTDLNFLQAYLANVANKQQGVQAPQASLGALEAQTAPHLPAQLRLALPRAGGRTPAPPEALPTLTANPMATGAFGCSGATARPGASFLATSPILATAPVQTVKASTAPVAAAAAAVGGPAVALVLPAAAAWLLSNACIAQGSMHMEQVLRAAMPESYDE